MTHDTNHAHAALEAIAAEPSTLGKQTLVKQALESPLFERICRAAYDPFITYGIARLPQRAADASGTSTLDEQWPWDILDELAARKLTGSAAQAQVNAAINALTPQAAELFRRVILRDLRAGFTDGTLNKVRPKMIPSFPYMRCSLPHSSNMADWDWKVGIIVQEKADGMFANVTRDAAGQTWMTSRQGTPLPLDRMGTLQRDIELALFAGTQTHGELTVYRHGALLPREDGNGIMNSLVAGGALPEGHSVRFDAWDQVPLAAIAPKAKYAVHYIDRLAALARQVRDAAAAHPGMVRNVFVIPTRVVRDKADAYAYYRELLKRGKEGVICKHPHAIWKDGTSKDQVKLKLEFEVDLEIVDFVPGTPGTKTEATFGSLLLRTSCSLLEVAASGITDAKRLEIHNNRQAYLGTVATIRANSIMHAENDNEMHSLFLPRVVEFRTDKREADTFQRVKDQMQAALEAA